MRVYATKYWCDNNKNWLIGPIRWNNPSASIRTTQQRHAEYWIIIIIIIIIIMMIIMLINKRLGWHCRRSFLFTLTITIHLCKFMIFRWAAGAAFYIAVLIWQHRRSIHHHQLIYRRRGRRRRRPGVHCCKTPAPPDIRPPH